MMTPMKTTLLIAAAIAATACAPSVHADDTDTTYLNALHGHGISNQNGDAGLIDLAHKVCAALADGISMNALEDAGDMNERNGLSDDDVKVIVKDAAASYCPEYIP